MYIIKQIPEDFVVVEIAENDFNDKSDSAKGKYFVYLMKKTNYNTEDAVQEICRQLNLQRKNVSYAGAKDRNAVTSQYITVLGKSRELSLKDISLTHVGFNDIPISIGNLLGNKFKITIRNLDDDEIKNIKKIDSFVNYFDSQRFSKNNAQIGKFMMNKKYKEACEIIALEESRIAGEIKQYLEQHKNAYLNALKLVPRKILMIYLHAYQSLLWNLAVETAIKQAKKIDKVPLLGFSTEFDCDIKEIYEKILLDENMTLRDFILRDFPEISLEGDYRKVNVALKDLEISTAVDDELNLEKKKVVIEFFLEKGAYATMAIKYIVGE